MRLALSGSEQARLARCERRATSGRVSGPLLELNPQPPRQHKNSRDAGPKGDPEDYPDLRPGQVRLALWGAATRWPIGYSTSWITRTPKSGTEPVSSARPCQITCLK